MVPKSFENILHTCTNGSNAADAKDVELRARCKYFSALL